MASIVERFRPNKTIDNAISDFSKKNDLEKFSQSITMSLLKELQQDCNGSCRAEPARQRDAVTLLEMDMKGKKQAYKLAVSNGVFQLETQMGSVLPYYEASQFIESMDKHWAGYAGATKKAFTTLSQDVKNPIDVSKAMEIKGAIYWIKLHYSNEVSGRIAMQVKDSFFNAKEYGPLFHGSERLVWTNEKVSPSTKKKDAEFKIMDGIELANPPRQRVMTLLNGLGGTTFMDELKPAINYFRQERGIIYANDATLMMDYVSRAAKQLMEGESLRSLLRSLTTYSCEIIYAGEAFKAKANELGSEFRK